MPSQKKVFASSAGPTRDLSPSNMRVGPGVAPRSAEQKQEGIKLLLTNSTLIQRRRADLMKTEAATDLMPHLTKILWLGPRTNQALILANHSSVQSTYTENAGSSLDLKHDPNMIWRNFFFGAIL